MRASERAIEREHARRRKSREIEQARAREERE